jgi:SAM-dependent methyltransferase
MTTANREQAEHWNSSEQADHWVTYQEQYDRMLGPFGDLVLGAAAASPGERVLDVGCGCGSTTLAAARAIGDGDALGADLSAPMLAKARQNAATAGLANVSFEQCDAQDHSFGRVFDVVISRFGVMFFADPVAAFANMRAATRPGGRLAFVCWQSLIANEWLTVAAGAMARHVPLPEPLEPGAPGMFALEEPDRVRHILGEAGWRDVTLTPQETRILVGGGELDRAVNFLRQNSLGRRMLAGADADTQDRAVQAVRTALAPHEGPDGVRLGAATWLVQATT